MKIGILKEQEPERRVVLLPEAIRSLSGVDVLVEKGCGDKTYMSENNYKDAGAILLSKEKVLTDSLIILKINPPTKDELSILSENQVLISALNPFVNIDLVKKLRDKKITSFSLDILPRTSRAQAMDILSSMATIAGYKAVLDAANHLPKFFPMFMSAAGTIKPAKMLILGAGVAGLQALSIARKLGAVVEVFDVRSAVKEEVLSLGGKFVDVEGANEDVAAGGYAVEQTNEFKEKQAKAIHELAIKSNVVICAAQIPGKKAPLLIKKETVYKMLPGSVIVDLAASTGGNCELTENKNIIEKNNVKIIGNSDYPGDMPIDASRMFGKNVVNFLKLIIDEKGNLNLNFEDEIVKYTCVTHEGEIINDRIKEIINN